MNVQVSYLSEEFACLRANFCRPVFEEVCDSGKQIGQNTYPNALNCHGSCFKVCLLRVTVCIYESIRKSCIRITLYINGHTFRGSNFVMFIFMSLLSRSQFLKERMGF